MMMMMMMMMMVIRRASFILFLFLFSSPFLLPHTFAGLPAGMLYNEYNGHYYELSARSARLDEVSNILAAEHPDGYMATITSHMEWEFILNSFITTDMPRIAVSAIYSPGSDFYEWAPYGNSPEGFFRIPMARRMDLDDCPYFCFFNAYHPDDTSSAEDMITVSSVNEKGPTTMDDVQSTDNNYFLVEYGNMTLLTSRVDTEGGSTQLFLLGHPTWDELVLSVAREHWNITIDNKPCTFQAPISINLILRGISCSVPAGTGKSLMVHVGYYSGTGMQYVVLAEQPVFSYAPPIVTSVGFKDGSPTVTIFGKNFGYVEEDITVVLGSMIQCVVNNIIHSGMFVCNPTSLLRADNMLPMSVSVKTQMTHTSSPILFRPETGHAYKLSRGIADYGRALTLSSREPSYVPMGNGTFAWMPGYLATITTPWESNHLKTIFRDFISHAWIGLDDLSLSGTFRWRTGPERGISVFRANDSLVYTSSPTCCSNLVDTQSTRPAAVISTDTQFDQWKTFPSNDAYRYFVEYDVRPTTPSISRILATGGIITIRGYAFGPIASNHDVTFSNDREHYSFQCINVTLSTDKTALSCIVPPSIRGNPTNLKLNIYYYDSFISNYTAPLYFDYSCLGSPTSCSGRGQCVGGFCFCNVSASGEQCEMDSWLNPHNNHTYKILPYAASSSELRFLIPPGFYPATITSYMEWDFIITSLPLLRSALQNQATQYYLGATLQSDDDKWLWVSGPESNFNVSASTRSNPDYCPYFCKWNAHYPDNFFGNETALGLSMGIPHDVSFDDVRPDSILHLIIEAGETTALASVAPTSGGAITVSLVSTNATVLEYHNNLVLMYPTISDWNVEIDGAACKVLELRNNPPGIYCRVPPGTGKSKSLLVEVQTSAGRKIPLEAFAQPVFSYAPPQVISVTPTFYQRSANMTIIGKNFGNDPQKIEIIFDATNRCDNITFLIPHTHFVCWVENLLNPGIPIRITVDGQSDHSSSYFLYNNDNGHQYQLSRGVATFQQARAIASSSGGYLTTLTSVQEMTFISYYYNYMLRVWLGAEDFTKSGMFRWNQGPEAGLAVFNSTSRVKYATSSFCCGSVYASDGDALAFSFRSHYDWAAFPSSLPSRYFIEIGTVIPAITFVSGSLGGLIYITGLALGPDASLHNVTVGPYTCSSPILPLYSSPILICSMPPANVKSAAAAAAGYIGSLAFMNLPATVQYMDSVLSSGSLLFNYTDTIDITPRVATSFLSSSQRLTIYGTFLFENDLSLTTVSVGPYACFSLSRLSSSEISCDLPYWGTGANLSVVVRSRSRALTALSTITFSCGDGICNPTNDILNAVETCLSCPIDCPTITCNLCGDGICNTGESCESCLVDCGVCPIIGGCRTDCGPHGTCASDEYSCICNRGWSGVFCDSPILPANVTTNGTGIIIKPPLPPPSTNSTGSDSDSDSDDDGNAAFSVFILELQEISSSNVVLSRYPISDDMFGPVPDSLVSSIDRFVTISGTTDLQIWQYYARFSMGTEMIIRFTQFGDAAMVRFAGDNSTISSGVLKASVYITGFPFTQSNTSLGVIMQQTGPDIKQQQTKPTTNNNKGCTATSTQQIGKDSNNNVGWTILQGSSDVQLYSTYHPRGVVDSKNIFIRTEIYSDDRYNTTTTDKGLKEFHIRTIVPSFVLEAALDPNFGLVVDLSSRVPSSCLVAGGNSDVDPVNVAAIVAPVVVGVVLLVSIIIGVIYYKKSHQARDIDVVNDEAGNEMM
eukprot:TRINITY_DN1588_c0_g2_i1.p1 TRINITY_DN1588_c0_g2~~TRINITY_DN1588_c0_g2_i1.p1  ORF type:complete len:1742 (-),score=163.61 TRINITY_DN1588_c0_g2_i1:105-5330(-)